MSQNDMSFAAFLRSGVMGRRFVATACLYFVSWSAIMGLCAVLMTRGTQLSTAIVVVITALVLVIVSLSSITGQPTAPVQPLLRRTAPERAFAIRHSLETTASLDEAAARAIAVELPDVVRDLHGEIRHISRTLNATYTSVDSATARDAFRIANDNAATLQEVREITFETFARTRELELKVDMLLRRAQSEEVGDLAARMTSLEERLSSVAEAALHAAAMEALRRVMREILDKTSASEGTSPTLGELKTDNERQSDG
jgi:hypothetical protein